MTKAKIKLRTCKKSAEETATACIQWYKIATDLQPLTLDSTATREDRINLLQLRLGHETVGEIILGLMTTTSEHCGSEEEDPLVHCLLECPQTRTRIHPPQGHGWEVAALAERTRIESY
ncbi:hypothetical protein Pcinc_031830 [Petrolisthes cinctipes]|uniref:Uncharacterized protein n=1 Tax=Petrolisthes cinctipes TaxID=88211 RepID=A0AAE1EVL0_PETCI|nr:hypothetical protein Pcinc_031830 [Petrolisthes cinctipes]